MRRTLLLLAALFCTACKTGNDASNGSTGSGTSGTTPKAESGSSDAKQGSGSATADVKADVPKTPAEPPPPPGHDFTPTAKALLVVGACGDGDRPDAVPEALLAKHCAGVKVAQTDYLEKWVKPASAWFKEKVPSGLPKKVVYPFAGGDLSTALTVYPDADEITTMSLEPAGDPRTLDALTGGKKTAKPSQKFEKALSTIQYELKFLYRVNFSNTSNMIDAMRAGGLPTNLVFALSALKIHGYEVTSVRYFRLETDGTIHYLDSDEVGKAPDPATTADATRNRIFANAEIRFKKPGGRQQIFRHLQVNLANEEKNGQLPPIKEDGRILKHLEAKGKIAAMTKAASYLLSWDSFSMMRDYLTDHVEWMVSDATGVAPKWGKPKGFEYETYGTFNGAHLQIGGSIGGNWKAEFAAQPKREIPFRFGYYDKDEKNHLVIMRKKS
ncbi:MAG: hypothetical protein KF773_02395 [Deltaproteobacteria bacterium]|nr:hypothetical protein [Deltaproteobacteria bacterium]MCW5801175.1 hypothetical protein [Deltaproteobacteria bacterium]